MNFHHWIASSFNRFPLGRAARRKAKRDLIPRRRAQLSFEALEERLVPQAGNPTITLNDPENTSKDLFGSSVAQSGSDVLVGSNGFENDAGVAYLYSTSGELLQDYLAPSRNANDNFGFSVALSGSNALIGAYGVSGNTGIAYLYSTSGEFLQTIDDPNEEGGDYFGYSVALSGSNVLVGADGANGSEGAAFLFSTSGELLQTFTDPNKTANDHFGSSLALFGTSVLVGASGSNDATGAVYLYNTSGQLLSTFTDPTNKPDDLFGSSVALSGSNVLVGAAGVNSYAGAAYLYGASNQLLETLSDPSNTAYDQFGGTVALSDSNVLVGASGAGDGEGVAYLYSTSGQLLETFTDPNNSPGDDFSRAASLSDSDVIVGASGFSDAMGAAYEYYLPSSLSAEFGNNEATAVGTAFDTALVAQVYGSSDEPIPGLPVTFTVNDSSSGAGATFTSGTTAVSDTNDEGMAIAPVLTANTIAGPFTVTATCDGLSTTFLMTNTSGAAASISPVIGGESATIDTAFGTLLQAQVKDSYGNPVANALVSFDAPASGPSGTFDAATSVYTNAQGIATAPALTANEELGTFTVTATATGVAKPADFKLTNFSGYNLQPLTEPEHTATDHLGSAVAVSGNDTLVGGPGVNSNTGAAYLYSTSGQLLETFTDPNNTSGDDFGSSVALSGSNVLVGAKGVNGFGAAYLYSLSGQLLETFTDPNKTADDDFSSSVALSGSNVLVGANGVNGFQGAAYLYSTAGQLLQTFTDPDNLSGDNFGYFVALSGSNVLVGANGVKGFQGAAYLYNTSGQLLQTFTDPNKTPYDEFGFSGALSGSDVLIGNYEFSDSSVAVYLYNTSGQLLQTFSDPNSINDDAFGASVSLSGDSVLVGGLAADGDSGTAYLYNTSGELLQTFTDPNGTSGDNFGFSVALSGSSVLVGALGVDGEAGAAYLYSTSGQFLESYTVSSTNAGDNFGTSVASSGSDVLVGAAGVSDSAGVAYLYSTSGNLLQTLTDPNNAANDAFGTSVALSGSDVLVGAPGLNGNSGAAYLYSTSGQLLQTFTDPNNKSDDFGISVALSGSDVLVGADGVDGYRGAAYLYSTSGQLLQTFTDPNNTGLDHFGFSVALSDNDALVGAYGVDGEEGAAYLYSTSGQLLQTFTDPNNTASDNFGYSVALSGNSMMVGAYGANGSAGAAYLYSTSDLLLQTFTDPNKTENDNFGTSVAMSGLNLLVGAPKVSGEGAVYIYDTFGHLLQTYNDPNNTANDYFGISLALSGENAVVGSFGTSDDAGAADEFLLPSSLTTLDGSNPSTVVGTAFGSTLEVQVTDSLGNPVTGASVSFIESDGSGGAGGTFTGTTIVSTNAFGIATAPTLTANDVAGSFTVSALLGSLYTTFNLTNSYGAATNLIPLGGSNQSTTLDDAFGTLLQAEVTDTYGNPVPNALVTFAVPATGPSGTFNATSSVLTDANGIATAPALTANNQLGIYTATATVANVGTTSFNLDNTSGKPTELNQDKEGNQTTVVGDTFLKPLEVEVLDTFGNPIPGAIVTFTESNGTTGAGGAFSGSTSVTTNSFGIAAAPTLTANDTAGSFAVTASIGKLYTTFLLNNSNGAPAEIIAAGAPDLTAVVGTAFGKHLEVQALDSFGNPIPGATVTFTEVNGGTGAGGSFTGTTTVSTNALGIATAPTLTANDMAGGFTVTATLGHLLASFPLSNTSGAPATITPLGENDLNTPKGYTYGELPEVQVIDSYGNPVANTPVTFTLPTSGATGSFSSTATMMTNAEGLATAPAITANYQTGTFTLAATVGGVLSPADFTLTNTLVPATMKVLAGSGQRSMIDTAFAKPLEVQVLTSGKVPVAGVTVYFTVPGSGASGTLAQGSVVTNAKGVATMPTLTANGIIGKWSVAARVDGDPEPAVFTVTNITGPAALISSLKGSNQSAKPGKAFATALEALVVDSQGNLVTGASVTFTIVSDAGSGGKFTGGKTTVVIATGAHGIATAPALIANAVPGDFTVKATYSVKGVPADMSCTFDLSIL